MNPTRYKWFYDNIHSCYYNLLMKWSFLPLGGEKRCRDDLISHIDFSENETILDMGCGTGGATRAILRRAGRKSEIFGLDLSAGQLKVARKRPELEHVQLLEGDAAKTNFADGYFDKVFITHVLHEKTRDARLSTLREAGRILGKDGHVIVLELDKPPTRMLRLFFGFWFFYWLPFNFETPTRKDMLKHGLENELRTAGFTDVIKTPKCKGVLQTVQGTKETAQS